MPIPYRESVIIWANCLCSCAAEAPVPSRFDTISRLSNSEATATAMTGLASPRLPVRCRGDQCNRYHPPSSRFISLAQSAPPTAHPVGLIPVNIEREPERRINRKLKVSHARLSRRILEGLCRLIAHQYDHQGKRGMTASRFDRTFSKIQLSRCTLSSCASQLNTAITSATGLRSWPLDKRGALHRWVGR